MKPYEIKKSVGKGTGLFATKNIKQSTVIFRVDLTKLPKYTIKQIEEQHRLHPDLPADHEDYIGNSKYIIDLSPASYMNHSCDTNTYYEYKVIGKIKVIALRDIKKGEELTHDYQICATDQIDNPDHWTLKCKCGSKKCRKTVTGDFFKLPLALKKKWLLHLPTYMKKKYKDRLKNYA